MRGVLAAWLPTDGQGTGWVLTPLATADLRHTDDSGILKRLYATKRGSGLAISPFGVCQVTLQDPTSSQSTQTT
jgi:hypothetical protein